MSENFLRKLFEICFINDFLRIIFKIFVGSGSESGLYEGEVRLEGQTQVSKKQHFPTKKKHIPKSQIPHGFGVMNYFSGDRHHRLNYTGPWRDGRRHGEGGRTAFADGSVYEVLVLYLGNYEIDSFAKI